MKRKRYTINWKIMGDKIITLLGCLFFVWVVISLIDISVWNLRGGTPNEWNFFTLIINWFNGLKEVM